ncbi:MAG: T9SS type A sorting domain-containing protein [Chitinophagales bacterium]|nr:T9SS type A sorting domain-containing protein [Chitinophagales bacterium]
MHSKSTLLNRWVAMLLVGLFTATTAHAATYTAVNSGTWSSTSTWLGGSAPGNNLNNDAIIINSGVTVTLDQSINLDGALSSFTLNGSLTTSNSSDIMLNDGSLSGNGSLTVDELTFGSSAIVLFTGNADVQTLHTSGSLLQIATSLMVHQMVEFTGGIFSLNNSGSLSLSSNANIHINGGQLVLNGGTFIGGSAYNVSYSGSNANTGIELTGAGLQNVTINLSGSNNQVSLNNDLTLDGTLTLTQGSLNLNGNDLTINGNLSAMGNGTISGNNSSNITFNGSGSINGMLRFANGSQTINNLTVNLSSNGTLMLGSDVMINGTLMLTAGSLSLNGYDLSIDGDISATGTGTITGNSGSNISIQSSGSLTGSLTFTNGSSTIQDLTIDASGTGMVNLGSDLTITGTLTLTDGQLGLNGNDLTINGNIAAGGTGTIAGNGSSNLTLNISGNLGGDLDFTSGASTLNNLSINSSGNGMIDLTSDLTLNGMLTLTNGQLVLNGNDLTLNGGIAASGNGTINSSSASSITINGSGNIAGMLHFASGGNNVDNLTINLSSNGSIMLGSDIYVNGMLTLNNGNLGLNGFDLHLMGDLSSTGNGTLMGNSTSDIFIEISGDLAGDLSFSSGSSTIHDLTIDASFGGEVSLGSDVMVTGMLYLTDGELALNGNSLTVANIGASGNGSITGDANASLSINGSSSTTGTIDFTNGGGATLNSLTISLSGGAGSTTTLNSDVTITGALYLQGGTLDLDGNDLTLGSGAWVHVSGNGMLNLNGGNFNGGSNYNLMVSGTTNVMIDEVGNGNGLQDVTINLTGNAMASLDNDLTVNGDLYLQSGVLDLNGNDLNIMGNITAGGMGAINSDSSSNITISTSQDVSGELSFATMGDVVGDLIIDIDGGGSIDLTTDVTVDGMLDLQNGTIAIGDNDLTIAMGGMVQGGSDSSYVMTDGQGSLVIHIATGDSTRFDVGTDLGYSAAVVRQNGSASGMFMVRTDNGVWSEGTTGMNSAQFQSIVDRTWYVESDLSSNINVDLTLEWSSDMEVNGFDRTEAYISHYVNAEWDSVASMSAMVAANGYFSITREDIQSLSPFSVVDKDASVGIQDLTAENLNVYPNPVVNVLNIDQVQDMTDATVAIYNINGQLVGNSTAANTIDVSNLSQGVYYVKVYNTERSLTAKFVKQ